MSVMNGFRTELINKILGFNPHIVVKPYDKKISTEKTKDIILTDLSPSTERLYQYEDQIRQRVKNRKLSNLSLVMLWQAPRL